MSEPQAGRLIKRYANRKLYDTAASRYVTLEELATMIQEGEDLRIIDNQSKADITAVTLAQILVEEEKRGGRRSRPLPALRTLIQRRIAEPVHQIRSSVEESVNRLIKSGEERADTTREQIRGWVEQNTHALEEIQRRVDERLKHVVPGLEAFTRLQRQIAELSERLDRIEAHLGLATDDDPVP
ncbi:MAG: polyhydroxyalkanoate synthesis regulator DNA-binding domain-containing protein [bacterium]